MNEAGIQILQRERGPVTPSLQASGLQNCQQPEELPSLFYCHSGPSKLTRPAWLPPAQVASGRASGPLSAWTPTASPGLRPSRVTLPPGPCLSVLKGWVLGKGGNPTWKDTVPGENVEKQVQTRRSTCHIWPAQHSEKM